MDAVDVQITFDTARTFAEGFVIPLVISGLGRTQVRNTFGKARIEMTEVDDHNPLVSLHGLSLAAYFSKLEMSRRFDRALARREDSEGHLAVGGLESIGT